MESVWSEVKVKYDKVELLSCSGWKLKKLPLVKQFINEESPKFKQLKVKYVGGDPRIVLYKKGKMVKKVDISAMNV